jgi:hypothetical protein
MLNRGDVDNHAGTLIEHRRQQRPVQSDRRGQIQVERAMPFTSAATEEIAVGEVGRLRASARLSFSSRVLLVGCSPEILFTPDQALSAG